MAIELSKITHSDFETLEQTIFAVETQGGDVTLKLEKVSIKDTLSPRDNHLEIEGVTMPPRQPFSLILSGPVKSGLESNSYYVRHKKLGRHVLFLSAFMSEQNSYLYEIAFN